MKIEVAEIKKIYKDALLNHKLTEEEAELITEERAEAELRGIISHGFMNIEEDIKKAGKKEKFKIVKDEKCYALIDGKKNIGELVGKSAMELAVKKAKEFGVGLVGMYNMHSYYILRNYVRIALENKMIGIVIDNGSSRVAPFGGIDPCIGANPISIGIPVEPPLILDMATSPRNMGEVRSAKLKNEKIPYSWAVDKEGNITDDPNRFNAFIPLGYKFYGLGLMIEILAGSFVNAKMGSKLKTDFDRGFLFMVIDPSVFTDLKTFQKEVEELRKEIKNSRKASGSKEILLPGERSERLKQENLKSKCLEIDGKIIEKIKSL